MATVIRCFFVTLTIILVLPKQASAGIQLTEEIKVNGFLEASAGVKFGNDVTKHDEYNLAEQRVQFKATYFPEFSAVLTDWMAELNLKGDFLVDFYYNAKTCAELREAQLVLSPLSWMDVKLGRQVFTWGTGDYLFINDLFPKDYVSFYIGRDDEYLKKPSDGIKFSFYFPWVNIDLVAIPFFEPNTLFSGDRVSFFDPFQGGISGRNSDRRLVEPAAQGDNTEYALRVFGHYASFEYALYFNRGFDKMPRGYLDEVRQELFYPRMNTYGASVRGPGMGGIVNGEVGYTYSCQDSLGDNRLIQNSMVKALVGYEKDLGNDFRVGTQYYYEQILDYNDYRDALRTSDTRWDEHRHLMTVRLTKLYKNQTVRAGLFLFFSPSDMDVYLRPKISYEITDHYSVTVGANLIWGRDDHTELGQTEHNKNIFVRVRYNF